MQELTAAGVPAMAFLLSPMPHNKHPLVLLKHRRAKPFKNLDVGSNNTLGFHHLLHNILDVRLRIPDRLALPMSNVLGNHAISS